MKKSTALLLLLLAIVSLQAQQPPVFSWVNQIGGDRSEQVQSITTDNLGNVYVTGSFNDTVDFDPGPGTAILMSSGVGNDIFVCKFDQHGMLIWARQMGGTDADYGVAVTVDQNYNVIVAGTFRGVADFDPGPGTTTLAAVHTFDSYLVKLDANGNFVWVQHAGGFGGDDVRAICLDPSGNIYSTGYFYDTIVFNPGSSSIQMISGGQEDIFITKHGPNGNLVWAKQIGGAARGMAYSIEEKDGFIYSTGKFQGAGMDFDPSAASDTRSTTGLEDIFVHKLSTTGQYVWTQQVGGPGSSTGGTGRDLEIDKHNNIYVVGEVLGSVDFDPGSGTHNHTSTSTDAYLLRLDSSGAFERVSTWNNQNSPEFNSMSLDSSGNVYVHGYFNGTTDLNPGSGSDQYSAIGVFDLCLVKLDTAGTFVWGTHFPGSSLDIAEDVAIDRLGNIYMTGTFLDSTDFDHSSNTAVRYTSPSTQNDAYLLKLGEELFSGVRESGGKSKFMAYPNPTYGMITVESSGNSELSMIDIVDLNGRVLVSHTVETYSEVNVALPASPGVYLLRLKENNGSISYIKAIKQ